MDAQKVKNRCFPLHVTWGLRGSEDKVCHLGLSVSYFYLSVPPVSTYGVLRSWQCRCMGEILSQKRMGLKGRSGCAGIEGIGDQCLGCAGSTLGQCRALVQPWPCSCWVWLEPAGNTFSSLVVSLVI